MDQSDNPKQTEESDYRSKFPSLDVAYDISNDLVAKQAEEIKALNDTSNTILATTTTLLGTVLVIQAVLLSRYPKNFLTDQRLLLIQGISLLPALFLYLIVLIANLLSRRFGRKYYSAPDLEYLYQEYLTKPESLTKASLFRALLEVYRSNKKTVRKKARWVNLAYGVQIFLALMLIPIIILQIYLLNYI